jgi:hypothetical protein
VIVVRSNSINLPIGGKVAAGAFEERKDAMRRLSISPTASRKRLGSSGYSVGSLARLANRRGE